MFIVHTNYTGVSSFHHILSVLTYLMFSVLVLVSSDRSRGIRWTCVWQ